MTLSVALLQLAAPGTEGRDERLARAAEWVGRVEAELIVLPELWLSGFFAFDRYEADAEPLEGPATEALSAAAARAGAWLVGGSLLERGENGALHNTAVVFDPGGELIARYRKTHLFGIGSGERELLTAGDDLCVVNLAGTRVALSLCYDLRFPELYRVLVADGAEVLVNCAAWPLARASHWELLLSARAVEDQSFVLGCGAAGVDHGVALSGRSRVVAPTGDVLARAGEREQELRAELDLASLRQLRRAFPTLADRRLQIGLGDLTHA